MKNFSKVLIVLIAVGLFTLVGCGNTGSNNDTGNEDSETSMANNDETTESTADSNEEESAETGGQTLEIWLPATATDGDDEGYWRDKVQDWETENNVSIEFQFVSWKDYEAKFASAVSTDTEPDIAQMYVEMLPTYVYADELVEIEPYLSEDDKENYTVLTDEVKIFGKLYGIPMSGITTPNMMFYNMDILNEIGEEPPETWDDIRRIAEKATQDTDGDGQIDQYGLAQGWGQTFSQDLNWNWYGFVWQNGGELFDDSGKCIMDSPEAIGAAQFLYDIKHEYNALPPDTMSLTNNEAFENYFVAGDAAIAIAWGNEGNFNILEENRADDFEYGISLALEGDNGGQGNWAAVDQWVIFNSSENKDLAWDFIHYMTAEEGAEKHHEARKLAPTTKDEPNYGLIYTREVLEEEGEEGARPLKAARRAPEVYDYLWKTLQDMMNDQISPEDAMKDVTDFANSLDYEI